ncbi:kinesin-like protein KIF20B isoform X2 [Denticeps clupeoides]|uniref:kinesin-like protein KIF20B isoform X2 n=1 Tax=Denticeps clupeoides TaxID=299321 RepID=UPI0010A4FA29|nr:kinesin-like protein KIF20B isoform X2 [Denticeps clupeoides]
MESCPDAKLTGPTAITVEDLKKDLLSDFSEFSDSQDSSVEKEHLKVYLRIRPFTAAERESGESQDCIALEPPDTVLLKAPRTSLSARHGDKATSSQTAQRFKFSQVYGQDASQREFFDGTVKALVRDVLEGRNSLVFTYGVTNAGKTFTFLGPDENAGILPRSLRVIFSNVGGRLYTRMNLKPHRCRDHVTLSDDQQKEEAAIKHSLFRLFRETDGQKSLDSLSGMKTMLEGSTLSDVDGSVLEDSFNLDHQENIKFSLWVSFCEIYNENIHDLLEPLPTGAARRAALKLCQDVRGNSFVKDLKWIQVNSADEAYKVMKLGKKNQSFSSTRLNHLSSRSIFSIRILWIDDTGTPRVQSVSELSLCDLAGSERCAKTQNKGDRLKEAGNINTSLLILGKCINALRQNQQSKCPQHVPFRESKLTHYLQGFFTGRGKACMMVNINQLASMYEETLNVLKFSAVAQKVVVLSTKTLPLPVVGKRSEREVSFIINNADRKNLLLRARRSSLVRWDTSLEDVQEHEDSEEEEEQEDSEEEESMLENTVQESDDEPETMQIDKAAHEDLLKRLEELRAQNLDLESRVREEVTTEFSELFSKMQEDYNERLAKECKLIEDRCEKRLEILQDLMKKSSAYEQEEDQEQQQTDERSVPLDVVIDSMCSDLAGIRNDAEAAQTCLETQPATQDFATKLLELSGELGRTQNLLSLKTEELEKICRQSEESKEALEAAKTNLECQELRCHDLMVMCQQKDEMLSKLQTAMDQQEEAASNDRVVVASVKEELVLLKANCTCAVAASRSSQAEGRKRRQAAEGLDGEPPPKKGPVGDQEEERAESAHLQKEVEQIEHLEQENRSLGRQVEHLSSELAQWKRSHGDVLRQKEGLQVEMAALQSGADDQAAKLASVEMQWGADRAEGAEKLKAAEAQLQERTALIEKLSQEDRRLQEEVARMRKELQEAQEEIERRDCRAQVQELEVSQQQMASEKLQIQARELDELKTQHAALKSVVSELEENARRRQDEGEKRDALERKEVELCGLQQRLDEQEKVLTRREAQLSELQKHRTEPGGEGEEDGAMAAVQEVRKREAEKRRELMAVAEEAIAQKDAELQKRVQDINRLKEELKMATDDAQCLRLDLRRRDEDSSDQKEKLADSKKQIQQVQKEISSMRDVEQSLRQRIQDLERNKSQLQNDLSNRDRTILQLKAQSTDSRSDETLKLYQDACKDLQAREKLIGDMRLALTEQEETQSQMDLEMETQQANVQRLTDEVEKLKERLLGQDSRKEAVPESRGNDAAQAQESLKLTIEKHQADRSKWLEEKMILIRQAKEAEERRNQEVRRFADDRERHARQQTELEAMSEHLKQQNEKMASWRNERDTLVAALEVQLTKLICSNKEKDQELQQLRLSSTSSPVEPAEGEISQHQSLLSERDTEILHLKEQLRLSETAPGCHRDSSTQTDPGTNSSVAKAVQDLAGRPLDSSTLKRAGKSRSSASSQGSTGFPSVLESSEISTDAGRRSRFPRPELEISFSPLQPDRLALKRQGDGAAFTVKIPRATRKRKSGEMEKMSFLKKRSCGKSKVQSKTGHEQIPQDGVEAENRRNTRTRAISKLAVHQEESSPMAGKNSQSSQSSLRSGKEGRLQKIGDVLQSSPTFLSSKAKKILGLMSGKSDVESGSSLSSGSKGPKRKPYRPNISSPMNIPAHRIIGGEVEDRESDVLMIKRRLRPRNEK